MKVWMAMSIMITAPSRRASLKTMVLLRQKFKKKSQFICQYKEESISAATISHRSSSRAMLRIRINWLKCMQVQTFRSIKATSKRITYLTKRYLTWSTLESSSPSKSRWKGLSQMLVQLRSFVSTTCAWSAKMRAYMEEVGRGKGTYLKNTWRRKQIGSRIRAKTSMSFRRCKLMCWQDTQICLSSIGLSQARTKATLESQHCTLSEKRKARRLRRLLRPTNTLSRW